MADLYSKVLAEGTLTTEASLYSPAASTHGTNVSLVLHNPGASTRIVTVKVQKSGGTARVIDRVQLLQYYTHEINGIHLGPSDDLRALQDAGTDITYVISGGTDA